MVGDFLAEGHLVGLWELLARLDHQVRVVLPENPLAPLEGALLQVVCGGRDLRLEQGAISSQLWAALNKVIQSNWSRDSRRVLEVVRARVGLVPPHALRQEGLPQRVAGDAPQESVPNDMVLVVSQHGVDFRLEPRDTLRRANLCHQAVHGLQGLHVHVRVVTAVLVQQKVTEDVAPLCRDLKTRVELVVLRILGPHQLVALLVGPDLDFPTWIKVLPLQLDRAEEVGQVPQLTRLPSEVELARDGRRAGRRGAGAVAVRVVPVVFDIVPAGEGLVHLGELPHRKRGPVPVRPQATLGHGGAHHLPHQLQLLVGLQPLALPLPPSAIVRGIRPRDGP